MLNNRKIDLTSGQGAFKAAHGGQQQSVSYLDFFCIIISAPQSRMWP